jgi:hypothetical protein
LLAKKQLAGPMLNGIKQAFGRRYGCKKKRAALRFCFAGSFGRPGQEFREADEKFSAQNQIP